MFDYIRAIAIITIVLCHFFLYGDLCPNIGRYLSGGGNMLFFLLSALLHGKIWQKKGKRSIPLISFFIKKIFRIGTSLWPFLLIIVSSFLLFDINFSKLDVLLNFMFLSAFAKLPGNGHLWFITVIMACYLMFYFASSLKCVDNKQIMVILLFAIVTHVILESLGLPGNNVIIVILCTIVFLKSNIIQDYCGKLTLSICFFLVLFNVVCLLFFLDGIYEKNRTIAYLLTDLCGVSWMVLALRFLPNKRNKCVGVVSNYSFELYLVHHTLCAGPLIKVSSISGSYVLQFVILLFFSLILASVLNKINVFLTKKIKLLYNRC